MATPTIVPDPRGSEEGMASRKFWLIASIVAAVAVYATMWIGYAQNWVWLDSVDTRLLQTFHDIGADRPWWVSFWVVFCTVFGPMGFRVVALVLVIVAMRRRNVATAMFLVVTIGLMGLVTEGAKYLAGRPRPATALAHAASTSFPSGHALGTMAALLAVGAVCLPHLRPRLRPWAVAAAVLVVLTVGLGRVALNVHHLSDVVAGWAMGYAYFAVCLVILRGDRAGVTTADETPAVPDTAR